MSGEGVLQRSMLGLLLFLVMINDLDSISGRTIIYNDDTTIMSRGASFGKAGEQIEN